MKLQLKRGTTPLVDAYTGRKSELVYDLDREILVIMNGVRPGGFKLGQNTVSQSRPVIASPVSGDQTVGFNAIAVLEDYVGPGTHAETQYQVSKTTDFSGALEVDTGWITDLTNHQLELEVNTFYSMRVRFRTTDGLTTAWSNTVTFKTANGYYTYYQVDVLTSADTEMSRITSRYTVESYQAATAYLSNYTSQTEYVAYRNRSETTSWTVSTETYQWYNMGGNNFRNSPNNWSPSGDGYVAIRTFTMGASNYVKNGTYAHPYVNSSGAALNDTFEFKLYSNSGSRTTSRTTEWTESYQAYRDTIYQAQVSHDTTKERDVQVNYTVLYTGTTEWLTKYDTEEFVPYS